MSRLFEHIRPLIRLVIRRAWVFVLSAVLLSAVGLNFARQLTIDTDFSNLIPSSYASVQALEDLRETVGSESTADLVIRSPSFEANRRLAEVVIPRALSLRQPSGESYLSRVDYERDTEFLEQNALYFASSGELDSLESYLRGIIRDARLEANPFVFDLDEEEGTSEEYDVEQSLREVYDQVVGKRFPVNEDSTIMVLRFYPSGSQTDIGFIEALYGELEGMVDELDLSAYHAEMEVTLAGRLLRQLVEVRAITGDVFSSFAAGMGAVLLIVVLYFFYKGYMARAGHRYSGRILLSQIARTPVMALLIGAPLIMSLTWTFGVAYLAYETLNLMTSTLGLVLFGLGIDYGIHFYARYTEERSAGCDPGEAAEETFSSTGQAIAVGAMTTAAALYVLVIADFRGFSEFGFIAGTGILFALVSMTFVMPALLVLFERLGLLNMESADVLDEREPARPVPGNGRRFPAARQVVLASTAAVVAALIMLPRVTFEFDFGALEPEYEEYDERSELVRAVYPSRGSQPAYVLLDDPSEVEDVVAAVERRMAEDTLSPTIDRVESLQDRFPMSDAARQRKLLRIGEIRELLADPFVQAEEDENIAQIERAAGTTEPILVEQVPESIRNQFTSKTGDVGSFVMIYPAVGLSDGRASIAFAEDVGTIVTEDGTTYHAGSTSLVAADMLRLMLKEAPYMVGITFLIVVLLMWVNFGSLRWAALAIVPLAVGVLWMLLAMELLGLRLNFYNLVVLPAVLGIGNDAGVHLVHRYREEGRGSIRRVLRYTGEHITMGSLTTMIGFGGLLLSFHPGLESIGQIAVVGIGMALLAALFFLPALLQWLEDREKEPVESEPEPAEEVVLK